MKHQNKWLIFSVTLGLLLAILIQTGNVEGLVAPLWLVGNALRALSLSGAVQNALAWGVVVLCSALPLCYMLVRVLRGHLTKQDWLLPIASVQIGTLLYFLVNPTLTQYPGDLPMADGFAMMYGWALVATLVGYVLLRVLKRVNLDATSGRHLPVLLRVSGLVLVAMMSYKHLALLLVHIQSTTDANTGDVLFTVVVLCVLGFFAFVPAVLGGVTLLWSGDVAHAMMCEPYGAQTIALCSKTARACNAVTVCTVLVSLGCNLVQVVLASQLRQANITVEIPLLTLLLSSVLYLLCHYIERAKLLADDNSSII